MASEVILMICGKTTWKERAFAGSIFMSDLSIQVLYEYLLWS